MKQVVYPEKGIVVLQDIKKPVCTVDTMLLKTLYSGLSNGTERSQMVGGPYGGRWPVTPGYQLVGEVIGCGRAITKFRNGDIVFYGNFGTGHTEFVPAQENDLLVKMDEADDLETAALWAMSSVGYRNTERAKITERDRVIVYGGGVIGQASAQTARALGARDVFLVAGDPGKLNAAKERGITPLDRTAPDFKDRLYAARPYSVCIETSGADVLKDIIGEGFGGAIMDHESRVALVAGRFQVEFNSAAAQGKALSLYQSTHFFQHHLDAFAALVRSGKVDLRPCLRDVVPIDDAVRVFETLRDDPRSLFGTVFTWR